MFQFLIVSAVVDVSLSYNMDREAQEHASFFTGASPDVMSGL